MTTMSADSIETAFEIFKNITMPIDSKEKPHA